MRAIENGGKTKQKKKNDVLWGGEEGKHYTSKAGFGEKDNKEVSSFIIVDGVVNTWSGLS